MPRPKGSKNKTALALVEQIAQVTAEIETLQDQIKEKKAELKKLNAEKAEEDKKRIMDAVLASGKTVDEIIAAISDGCCGCGCDKGCCDESNNTAAGEE